MRIEIGLALSALSAKATVSRWRLLEFEAGNIELRADEVERIGAALRNYAQQKMAAFARFAAAL
jgi:hypothetical protein